GTLRIDTPSASIAAWVARQSSLARNPCTTVRPSAIAPSINARCEMDLSPGTAIVPPTRSTGSARKLFGCWGTAPIDLQNGLGVCAEHLEQRRLRFDLLECLTHGRILGVAVEIDEEHVVPFAL